MDQEQKVKRAANGIPNDLKEIEVGSRMEHRISRRRWCMVVFRGVSAERFVYQRLDNGRVYSSSTASVRQPSKFRWPTVEGPPVEAAPPMEVATNEELANERTAGSAPVERDVPVEAEAVPMPPAGTPHPALPREPPPIVMNGDGNEVLLGEHRIPLYVFRGVGIIIVGDLDAPLEYQPGNIAEMLRRDWKDEVVEGEHYRVLKGAELREFKASMYATRATRVASKASHITILTEAGIDRVLLLTKKPAGVRLRAFVADEVLPKLRRGEAVPPVTEVTEVTEAPAAMPESLDERIARIVAAAIAQALPQAIQACVDGAVEALRPLFSNQRRAKPAVTEGASGAGASPASPKPGTQTQLPYGRPPAQAPPLQRLEDAVSLVPRDYRSRRDIAQFLSGRFQRTVTEAMVSQAIEALHVTLRPKVGVWAVRGTSKQTRGGVQFPVPHEFFAPSVVEEIAAFLHGSLSVVGGERAPKA